MKGWRIAGYVVFAMAAVLVARILYEETLLTWSRGPQMVGFALAHGAFPWILLAGIVGVPGSAAWLLGSALYMAWKKIRPPLVDSILLAANLALLGLLFVPYAIWEEVDVHLGGPSGNPGMFLFDAAGHGNARLAKYLLASGVDVNRETGIGTPLSAAVVSGHLEMVRFLLSRGAQVNYQNQFGNTVLMNAADSGQLEAAKILIGNGADPCITNKEGHTAEGLARKYHHVDVADYLAEYRRCPEKIVDYPCVNSATSVCVH